MTAYNVSQSGSREPRVMMASNNQESFASKAGHWRHRQILQIVPPRYQTTLRATWFPCRIACNKFWNILQGANKGPSLNQSRPAQKKFAPFRDLLLQMEYRGGPVYSTTRENHTAPARCTPDSVRVGGAALFAPTMTFTTKAPGGLNGALTPKSLAKNLVS